MSVQKPSRSELPVTRSERAESLNSVKMCAQPKLILPLLLAIVSATPSAISAQAAVPLAPIPPAANPSFDVATIKPSDASEEHGTSIRHNGRHIIAYNISLAELMSYAYGLHARQIVGGPSPLLAAHFDVDGVPDIDGHADVKQTRLMFQKLLVSRFKLAFHHESRELSAYAIQVAKNGPHVKLTASKQGDSTNFSYTCQALLTVRNYSISDFAKGMQDAFLDRPTVDQTGLQGRYDFDLKWSPGESQSYCPGGSSASRDDSTGLPELFTAIREQLGLKIIPTKAPVQVMVIDHIESPSEN